MRLLLLTLLLASAGAQTPSGTLPLPAPSFDMATTTIKPSSAAACCARTFSWNGRHFATHNTTLKYLVQWAYNVQADQVAGGPDWMDAVRFEVSGEMDRPGNYSVRQWKLALQQVLADRFQLQLHLVQKEMPAYLLVVAAGGPKISPSPGKAGDGGKRPLQFVGFSGSVRRTMSGGCVEATLPEVMGDLERMVSDRPILDRTGLTGTYTFDLSFTREDPRFLGTTQLPEGAEPNLFDALKNQLGLKLEPANAPVPVFVIDHADTPTGGD